jgi:hypothetical protein
METRLILRVPYLALLALAFSVPVLAQRAKPFQGEWKWAVYAKNRSELPPAYHDAPLSEIPGAAIYLKITQRGHKLTGEYSGSRRFLAKLEDGDFDAIAKGNTTKFELTSGFNGTVTVRLTLQGNRLHWKITKQEGEHYFPDDVYLRRLPAKKRRR